MVLTGWQRQEGALPLRERIYAAVARIPHGKIATYGQIATLAGLRGHARQVGYALHALPDESPIPWYRVVNARGEISRRSRTGADREQRQRLEAEGVVFDSRDRIDLKVFRWQERSHVLEE